jgi:Icc-related predicted phosphoesterase
VKLLLFSDLHADTDAAAHLARRARSFGADVMVGAGDFGNGRRDVAACIPALRSAGIPAILVPGNSESLEELADACRGWPEAHVLHGTGCFLGGVPFFGLGGGVPVTPFGAWSYDFTEEEAAALLVPCPPGGVLVTHSPPNGAVDVSSRGQSLGSVAVRDTIVRVRPLLVVCGHIHASAGQQAHLSDTPVVNAGPNGVEWLLPETPLAY